MEFRDPRKPSRPWRIFTFARPSTTAGGVEYALVLVFIGVRVVDFIQAGLAQPLAFRLSPRPGLELAVAVLSTVVTVLICRHIWRRKRYDQPWVAAVDVGVGVGILGLTGVFTSATVGLNSWAIWTFPVTLGTVGGAAIAFRQARHVAIATVLLSGSYLVGVAIPLGRGGPDLVTGLVNAAAYPAFAWVVRLLVVFLRRLGHDADAAREQAAEAARELERERQRNLLHDPAGLLGLLSRPDLPPGLLATVRRQARDAENTIRTFLRDQPVVTTGFGEELAKVADGFADLPLVLNIDDIGHEPPEQVVKAVRGAVETLLHNVRRYASASEVVIYATTGPGSWDVSIGDDGVGFDPSQTPEGYGLGKQVRDAIDKVGGQVQVESAPQAGTLIQMSGEWAPSGRGEV